MRSATRKKIGKDKSYREFILAQPCCYCEAVGIEQPDKTEGAHIGPRSYSTKRPDRDMLPLCGMHHAELHAIGPVAFWREIGVTPERLIERFNEKYDGGERPA